MKIRILIKKSMTYCSKITGKGKPVHSLIGNIIIKLLCAYRQPNLES